MHKIIVCITRGSRVPESRFPTRTPSQTRPNLPGDHNPKTTPGVLYPCSVAVLGGAFGPFCYLLSAHLLFRTAVRNPHSTRAKIACLHRSHLFPRTHSRVPIFALYAFSAVPPLGNLGFRLWNFLGHWSLEIGHFAPTKTSCLHPSHLFFNP